MEDIESVECNELLTFHNMSRTIFGQYAIFSWNNGNNMVDMVGIQVYMHRGK